MPGLSAKVFRTYNASVTLEAELELLSIDTKESEKVRAVPRPRPATQYPGNDRQIRPIPPRRLCLLPGVFAGEP